MIKRFFLLSIFSLAFVSVIFSNEVKNENETTQKIVQEVEKELTEKEQSFEDVKQVFLNLDSKLYKDFPWEFMVKKFNDELAQKVDTTPTDWGFVTGSLLLFVLTIYVGKVLLEVLEKANCERHRDFIVAPTFCLSSSCFLIALLELFGPSIVSIEKIIRGIDRNALIDFLNNWSENKKMTPEELHEFFDKLNELNKNGLLPKDEKLIYIVENIRNLALRKTKARAV